MPRRRPKRAKHPAGAKQSNNLIAAANTHLKPKLDVNDEVETLWGAGIIKSYREVKTNSPYGPKRIYQIIYDDELGPDEVEDHDVLLKTEHLLSLLKDEKSGWVGVKNVVDRNCDDVWAQKVGWWVATVDGEELSFSLLAGKSPFCLGNSNTAL